MFLRTLPSWREVSGLLGSIDEQILTLDIAYSGCMDFILALLPWLIIWKLEMKKREKIGIALAMSMGVL